MQIANHELSAGLMDVLLNKIREVFSSSLLSSASSISLDETHKNTVSTKHLAEPSESNKLYISLIKCTILFPLCL